MPSGYPEGGVRRLLADFIFQRRVQQAITGLILLNAVTLGLETAPSLEAEWGSFLRTLDGIIIAIFAVEVALRIVAFGPGFFRGGWNWFDFIIVGISLIPAAGNLSVLRSLRILRVLRLISVVPQMRTVVTALLQVIPGMGTVALLLLLIFYVGAVMATKLFGQSFPEWFGSIGASMYSLFQIMTLESWSMGIVRPVMEQYPLAWAFFVPFILITTFAVLNLFVAIVVDAMQSAHKAEAAEAEAEAHAERLAIVEEVRALRSEIAGLRLHLSETRQHGPDT
jgi:voltage-gated sodium channel